jgi:predicted N-acetyltransferase YhbS
MKINLRQETPADYNEVSKVIENAFKNMPYSDQKEHLLVERLRKSDAFVPKLSIVAACNNEIVGHIILTKIKVKKNGESFVSLALAPVSVKPDYQKMGIGGKLIRESHRIAKELGFKSIILLGHKDYYPKFGYSLASKFGIKLPFEVPEENCMAIELIENGLKGISGIVAYPKAFYE